MLTDRRQARGPLVATIRAAVDGGARAVVLREFGPPDRLAVPRGVPESRKGTVPPGVPIDYIGQPDCDLAFYSNHTIASLRNFQCATESTDAFFLVWQDRLAKLAPSQRGCLQPLAQSSSIDSHGARVLMIEKK